MLCNDCTLSDQGPEVIGVDIDITLELVQKRRVDPIVGVILLHPEELAPGLLSGRAGSGARPGTRPGMCVATSRMTPSWN